MVEESTIISFREMARNEFLNALRDRDKDYWEGYVDCLEELFGDEYFGEP